MDAEIDRILAMSDEEVLAEVRASGEDPEEIARRMREMFERAVAATSLHASDQSRGGA